MREERSTPLHVDRVARRPSRASPSVSVVVAAPRWSGGLTACLASITSACEREGAELIVVCGDAPPEPAATSIGGQGVRHIDGTREARLEELRAMGMRAAKGDIVLMLEPSRLAGIAALDRAVGGIVPRLELPRPSGRARSSIARLDPGVQG
jgi:hypothetical protein